MKRSIQVTMWSMAAAALLVAPVMAQQVKIGVVDYGRLMEESAQAKAVQDVLRGEFAPKNTQLQQEQATLKAREEKLQKDGATMSADQRSKSEKNCAMVCASWRASRARRRTTSMRVVRKR